MSITASWHKDNTRRVLTHIVVWAVILSLPYLLNTHHGATHTREEEMRERAFFYLNQVTVFLWIVPFYLNAYLLTPRLFYRRQYLLYGLSLAVLFSTVAAIHVWLYKSVFAIQPFNIKGSIGFLLPAFALVIAVGTAIKVVSDKREADKREQEKQEENLKTELSFLRSQINPHFIFNILNNLVALEQMKSKELGPTIFKLSSLMQYMLYETDGERVPLDREIEYLQSYIDLQSQRFGGKVPITAELDLPDSTLEIEPMLLIPFVENAFKHGVGMISNPSINIHLETEGDNLKFIVKNRFDPRSTEERDRSSGIGLGNVTRRLKLLYGDKQQLDVRKENDQFIVELKLYLGR
jgi:two-component system LytT family sensor kinase